MVHSICRDSFDRGHYVRAFAPLLLLCLLQASAVAPPQSEARKRLSEANVFLHARCLHPERYRRR
jgi:hypothetical protein